MNKSELIAMVEALQLKQKRANATLRTEKMIENRAYTERYIRNISSVCDRLVFNWNMLPDSQNFFENTLAEAELFLNDKGC